MNVKIRIYSHLYACVKNYCFVENITKHTYLSTEDSTRDIRLCFYRILQNYRPSLREFSVRAATSVRYNVVLRQIANIWAAFVCAMQSILLMGATWTANKINNYP